MKSLYNAILITGANRGLGLAMAKSFVEKNNHVIATYRTRANSDELFDFAEHHKTQLFPLQCDISDDESVMQLRDEVDRKFRSLDILINNAGVMPRSENSIERMDPIDFLATMNVNTIGPVRMVKAFLPLIRVGKQKKIVHISSAMGSITRNDYGKSYSYRVSKSALNMLSKTLAHELRLEKILSAVLHPGWVRTEMGGIGAEIAPDKAGVLLANMILDLKLEKHSGGFFDYRGLEIPW